MRYVVGRIINNNIIAATAKKHVAPCAAVQEIVAAQANKDIIPNSAKHGVFAIPVAVLFFNFIQNLFSKILAVFHNLLAAVIGGAFTFYCRGKPAAVLIIAINGIGIICFRNINIL